MSTRPLVSVIIPNYNHSAFLVKRLESVLNQTYSNIEVILLDDCSTDDSRDILNRYKQHHKVSQCVFNEVNSGNTFIQWQKGIELAKGDYIWIAESDDFCELNFLQEVIKPLLYDSEVVLSYCQSNRINDLSEIKGDWSFYTLSFKSKVFDKMFVMYGNEFIENFLIQKNVIPNVSAVVIKNNIQLKKKLTINENLRYCGDWLFYLKLVVNNKVAFNPKKLNYFRYHFDSVIANVIKDNNKENSIKVDIALRQTINEFLINHKPSNYFEIVSMNNKLLEDLKYDWALNLIANNQFIRGYWKILFLLNVALRRNRYFVKIRKKYKAIMINLKS